MLVVNFCTLTQGTEQYLWTHPQNVHLMLYLSCSMNFMLYTWCLSLIFFFSAFLKLKANWVLLDANVFLSWFDHAKKSEEKDTWWPDLKDFWRKFYYKLCFFNFLVSAFFYDLIIISVCCISVLYNRVVWTSYCIREWCMCCTSVFHKRFFVCCIYSKQQNLLITGKRNFEEPWLGIG